MKKSDLPFLERLYRLIFRKLNKNKVCIASQKTLNDLKHNRIIFYLNYPKSIHFGDTLWFEPIIRLFAKTYENVYVYPSKAMSFYFKQLNYSLVESDDEINKNDILVTRTDLAYFLRNRKTFFIDFSYLNIRDKLIDSILMEVEKILSLPSMTSQSKPLNIDYSNEQQQEVLNKFGCNAKTQYVVFNNYIDSFDLQMKIEELDLSRELLYNFARDFKIEHPEYKIIYTGSQKDFNALSIKPEFIDIDLRGKTIIDELFILVAANPIVAYIGYDTFLMHLFNLYNKDSYIKLKPGYNATYNQQVKDFVAIPYSGATNNVTFI